MADDIERQAGASYAGSVLKEVLDDVVKEMPEQVFLAAYGNREDGKFPLSFVVKIGNDVSPAEYHEFVMRLSGVVFRHAVRHWKSPDGATIGFHMLNSMVAGVFNEYDKFLTEIENCERKDNGTCPDGPCRPGDS